MSHKGRTYFMRELQRKPERWLCGEKGSMRRVSATPRQTTTPYARCSTTCVDYLRGGGRCVHFVDPIDIMTRRWVKQYIQNRTTTEQMRSFSQVESKPRGVK